MQKAGSQPKKLWNNMENNKTTKKETQETPGEHDKKRTPGEHDKKHQGSTTRNTRGEQQGTLGEHNKKHGRNTRNTGKMER